MYTISYNNHSHKTSFNELDFSKLLVIIPVFNEEGYIQGLSIHLDKTFNNSEDI